MSSTARWRGTLGFREQEAKSPPKEEAHEPTALQRYLQHLDPQQVTTILLRQTKEALAEEPTYFDE